MAGDDYGRPDFLTLHILPKSTMDRLAAPAAVGARSARTAVASVTLETGPHHGEKGRRFRLEPAKTLKITGIAAAGKFAREASRHYPGGERRKDRDDVKAGRLKGVVAHTISAANAHPKMEISQ